MNEPIINKMVPMDRIKNDDGLYETRFRILNNEGFPTEVVAFYLHRDLTTNESRAIIAELRNGDERLDISDPLLPIPVMREWIAARI